jgi:zinc transporter ZupT
VVQALETAACSSKDPEADLEVDCITGALPAADKIVCTSPLSLAPSCQHAHRCCSSTHSAAGGRSSSDSGGGGGSAPAAPRPCPVLAAAERQFAGRSHHHHHHCDIHRRCARAAAPGGPKGGGAVDLKAALGSSHHADHAAADLARTGLLSALAVGIHNLPEGLASFAATMASPSAGAAIAVAIALHNIPEGVAVAMPLAYASGSRWKVGAL